MGFKEDFLSNYKAIMDKATEDDSPYDKAKTFINAEFEAYNLSEKEKADLTIGYLTNVTNSITNNAMQIALALTDKEGKYAAEVANLTAQGDLIRAQVNKTDADTSYTQTQEEKLVEQVDDNKIIKAMDSIGDMIGTVGAGGLKPTSSMWGTYFGLNQVLTGLSAPSSPDLTKV